MMRQTWSFDAHCEIPDSRFVMQPGLCRYVRKRSVPMIAIFSEGVWMDQP